MKLICITGIDGSGKTTLAHKAVASLRKDGRAASYVYGRTYPVLSRLLMALGRATLLRKKDLWRDYSGYTASKTQVMRNPFLKWTYTTAILLDYYFQIWLKLSLHVLTKRYVIIDRYIYDTVINDLSAHLEYTPSQTLRAIDRYLRLLPKPALVILIDLPEEIAFGRKDDIPHIDYLRERRGLYQLLRDRAEFEELDGAQYADKIWVQAEQLITQIDQ